MSDSSSVTVSQGPHDTGKLVGLSKNSFLILIGLGLAMLQIFNKLFDPKALAELPSFPPDGIRSPPQLKTKTKSFPSKEKTQVRYTFTAAICSIVKDGEAYFEEWIDYHLLGMGFDNIYLYDNSEKFELKNWYQNTRNHSVYSRVFLIHHPKKNQVEAMTKCIESFGKKGPKHDYVALIDLDEFLVIPQYPQSYTNIKGVLQDYLVPYGGALTVNWMIVGDSNRSVYAPLPVTKRFQYREPDANSVIKSIVKSSDFVKLINPHSAILKEGKFTRTTKAPGHKFKKSSAARAVDGDRPSNVLLLYHFRYTSNKEYLFKKCTRGRPNKLAGWCTANGALKNDTPTHIKPQPGTIFDDKPWQFLKSNVPKYRMYDQFEDFH